MIFIALIIGILMQIQNNAVTYWDKYDRLHDKPTVAGEPSSNNGWIYTAYYYKIPRFEFSSALVQAGEFCAKNLTRHPFVYDNEPPISRDEILGLAYLGFLKPEHLNDWNFAPKFFKPPKFNLLTFLDQATEAYGEHRNYFWKQRLSQLYHVAFSVPLTDRYFLLQTWGKYKWYYPSHLLYASISKIDSIFGGESGIRYLKYDKSWKAMQAEFPADHPLRK
jgi:hypothetical protein